MTQLLCLGIPWNILQGKWTEAGKPLEGKGPMHSRETHRRQVQTHIGLLIYLAPSECLRSGWATRGQVGNMASPGDTWSDSVTAVRCVEVQESMHGFHFMRNDKQELGRIFTEDLQRENLSSTAHKWGQHGRSYPRTVRRQTLPAEEKLKAAGSRRKALAAVAAHLENKFKAQ